MKYSNLSTETCLKQWIAENSPNNLNQIDSDGLHILDWIITHYRGKSERKMALALTLFPLIDLSKVSIETLENLWFLNFSDFKKTLSASPNNLNYNLLLAPEQLKEIHTFKIFSTLSKEKISLNLNSMVFNQNPETINESVIQAIEPLIPPFFDNIDNESSEHLHPIHYLIYKNLAEGGTSLHLFKILSYVQKHKEINFESLVFPNFNKYISTTQPFFNINKNENLQEIITLSYNKYFSFYNNLSNKFKDVSLDFFNQNLDDLFRKIKYQNLIFSLPPIKNKKEAHIKI